MTVFNSGWLGEKIFIRTFIVIGMGALFALSACSSREMRPVVSDTAVSSGTSSDADLAPQFLTPERWVLDNGLTVLFAADDEIPVASGTLFTRGGILSESMDDFGVAIAMGDQLRQGGTSRLAPEGLDQRLAELSASIDSSVGQEFGRVQFSSLSSDFEEVFELFADVVRRPRFDEARLELWRGQSRESMRRRIDNPSSVASISFNQALYGETPYGTVVTQSELGRFTRANLQRSYERFIRPNGAILAISGRLDRGEVERLTRKLFGDWKVSSPDVGIPEPPIAEPERGILFIELPLEQSTIIAGHRGVARLTPDHLAIELFNNIFGSGGFGSRLMKQVRSDAGLAYSVYGAIAPALHEGKNLIFIQTRTEATGRALVKALDELLQLQSTPVGSVELEESRGALLNSFVFNFDSPGRILGRSATFELLSYPSDYDQKYIEGVQTLTAEDVQAVAQRRWNLSEFSVVVVGNSAARTAMEQALSEREEFKGLLPIRRARFDEKMRL